MAVGYLLFGLVSLIFIGVYHCCEVRNGITENKLCPDRMKRYLALCALGGFFSFLSGVFSLYAINEAQVANINQGAITGIFYCSCIFASFFAFILFKEKLPIQHFIGIVFMIVAAVILCFSNGNKNHQKERLESPV